MPLNKYDSSGELLVKLSTKGMMNKFRVYKAIAPHLVEEGELSLAAGLVAELGHADRLAVGLFDGEAQNVPAMKISKLKSTNLGGFPSGN